MSERTPIATSWKRKPVPAAVAQCGPSSAWRHPLGLRVFSSLEQAELPGTDGVAGPTYHISVSLAGRRPTESQALLARKAFGMLDAEEDNHHPGNARHYFMPVDPQYRGICECKVTERTVVERDGYAWTTPRDEAQCRGCELSARLGSPCPLHEQESRP